MDIPPPLTQTAGIRFGTNTDTSNAFGLGPTLPTVTSFIYLIFLAEIFHFIK